MITIDKAVSAITRFVDTSLPPQLESWKKLAIGVYVGLAASNIPAMFEQYKDHPLMSVLNVVHDNQIDVDRIYSVIVSKFPDKIPVTLPFIGEIRFTRADLDSLYSYMIN